MIARSNASSSDDKDKIIQKKRVRFNLPTINQTIRYSSNNRTYKILITLSCVAFVSFILLYCHVTNQPNEKAFTYCINSFRNRDHPLNNGVSLRIGLFSVWNRVEERTRARQSIKQWIPSSINFNQHCMNYATFYRSRRLSDLPSPQSVKPSINQFASPSICGGDVPLPFDWWSVYDNIEFVFVIGRPPDEGMRSKAHEMMQIEHEQFNDIEYLSEYDENMNDGKSLYWFRKQAASNQERISNSSTARATSNYPVDYVMKLDEDSYLHLPHLVQTARSWRQTHLQEVYYGFAKHSPHERPPIVEPDQLTRYHSGMGYLMSADLLAWLLTPEAQQIIETTTGEGTPAPPNVKGAGHEDLNWGLWFHARGRALKRHENPRYQLGSGSVQISYQLFPALLDNFINGQPQFYTYPGKAAWASISQFRNDTVLVHELKDTTWFHRTVKHFMCQQPQVFDWTNNQFWLAPRSWYHSWYLFHPDGSLQEFRDWWNGFGQSFREDWINNHSNSSAKL